MNRALSYSTIYILGITILIGTRGVIVKGLMTGLVRSVTGVTIQGVGGINFTIDHG